MAITRRILSLLLITALLAAPCGAFAQEYVISAGEVTTTAIKDAYVGGMQIDVSADFGGEVAGEMSERAQAACSLLEKTHLALSFYDDFGTARVRGALTLDGITLFEADIQLAQDGSVQMVTNLTGSAVLTLPAGALAMGKLSAYADENVTTVRLDDPAFAELPAFDRLRIAWEDILLLVTDHLLGWVSYVQRDTDGKLYTFDYSPQEATSTRDAVAVRMIGTINSWDFCKLFYNILSTIRDQRPQFQQALADSLAEMGVTRYQVRRFIDGLLPTVVMDPAVEWVQPSATVYDDGALCTFGDVVYVVKKLYNRVDEILSGSGDDELKLVVSYDEGAKLVGFDADVPGISDVVPYAGSFTYSNRTDEDARRTQRAHGEMTLSEDLGLEGDLLAHRGVDVDGKKESDLTGYLDLRHADGSTVGLNVDMGRRFETDGGDEAEAFDGYLALALRESGEQTPMLRANVSGETAVDAQGFALEAMASAKADRYTLTASIEASAREYDEEPFPDGETLDLTQENAKNIVRMVVLTRMAGLTMQLSGNSALMQDIMTLLSGADEVLQGLTAQPQG